jgi:hypothetical protein
VLVVSSREVGRLAGLVLNAKRRMAWLLSTVAISRPAGRRSRRV